MYSGLFVSFVDFYYIRNLILLGGGYMRDMMTLSYVWHPELYFKVRKIIESAGYDPVILDELIELYLNVKENILNITMQKGN